MYQTQGMAPEVVPEILTDGVDLAMMAIAARAKANTVREGKAATRLQALARWVTVRVEPLNMQVSRGRVAKDLPLFVMPELVISPIAHEAAIQGIALEPSMLTNGVDLAMMAIALEAEAKAVREG